MIFNNIVFYYHIQIEYQFNGKQVKPENVQKKE